MSFLNRVPIRLRWIVFWGALLRLFFVLVGARVYYGSGNEFLNNDSRSYMGVMNLFEHGLYTFDMAHPDAPFGRVPTYPLFWGAHYLLFGEQGALYAVAASQTLMDLAVILMMFGLGRAVRGIDRDGLWAAFLYASYPFVIIWVSLTATEAFATFLTVAIAWVGMTRPPSLKTAALAGALIGAAVLTREYLGLMLLGLSLFQLMRLGWMRWPEAAKFITVMSAAFVVVFSAWPLRNYVFHSRVIVLRPENSGYHRYERDITRSRAWINSWDIHADTYLDPMTKGDGEVPFPDEVFADASERAKAQELVALGRRCGAGFYSWRHNQAPPTSFERCEGDVARGFDELRVSFMDREPLSFFVLTPARNLAKIFFKSSLTDRRGGFKRLLIAALFAYRSVLVLLGFVGAVVFRRRPIVVSIVAVSLSFYLFLCLVLRFVEMRYLLQFESLALIPVALLCSALHGRFRLSGEQPTEDAPGHAPDGVAPGSSID